MEEMREAAMAYYANMSSDQQQQVVSLFNSMDANGDRKVSIQEYLDFLKTKYQKEVPQNLFNLLDANNDGTLSFEECITFYYWITFNHAHSSFSNNDVLLQQHHRKRDKLKRRTKKVLKFCGKVAWEGFISSAGN